MYGNYLSPKIHLLRQKIVFEGIRTELRNKDITGTIQTKLNKKPEK